MKPSRRGSQLTGGRSIPIIVAGLAGLVGYYGPWVPHRAAGLVVIGLDLAEYVKFLPKVAPGPGAIAREIFYLPLFTVSMGAALLASRRSLPGWLRWGLAVASVPAALAMLPPAWSPAVLRLPEFRLQMVAMGACLLAVPLASLTRYLPNRLVLTLMVTLALAAAIGPAWGFSQALPTIGGLYGHTLHPGWGFWLSMTGFLGVAFFACAEILRSSDGSRPADS